jgi:hypothetical protein
MSQIIFTDQKDGGITAKKLNLAFAAIGTGTGTGDMLKSTYDTNNNGVVDTADSIAWTKVTGAPTYMLWVPYTGPPQSFLAQDLTRDGDWTMVANTNTSDRPAPQSSGTEEDLLPSWTPTTQSAPPAYTVYNEWTINTAGWIDQYGVDVLSQNAGKATHTITLQLNGVTKDSFTATPNNTGVFWQNITPLMVLSGNVIRVSAQVSQSGNNFWYQQVGLFATAPTYCSLAVGSKDGASAGTTAYGAHLLFQPGTKSPNWDVVAYGGAAAGGGGGGVNPGTWQTLSYGTGWSEGSTARYRVETNAAFSKVIGEGIIAYVSGAASLAFTLPAGALPSVQRGCVLGGYDSSGDTQLFQATITTAGAVNIVPMVRQNFSWPSATNGSVYLDNLSFAL